MKGEGQVFRYGDKLFLKNTVLNGNEGKNNDIFHIISQRILRNFFFFLRELINEKLMENFDKKKEKEKRISFEIFYKHVERMKFKLKRRGYLVM